QFAPHWFLGGSFAYGQDWLTSSDGATSGSGQNVEAGFSLKHEVGDWLFALAGFAGHQDFRTARLIALPGAFSVADAKPLTNGGGLRLRIARTFGSAHAYLRPFLDLDGVYAAAPGYTETGAGALDLQVSGHRQLLGVATPMLEIGGRTDLPDGAVLRSYLQGGVSFLSQGSWQTSARFIGAPDRVGGFASTMPMDRVQGRIGAGLQLLTRGHFDLRLQYDGTFSQNLTSHGGTLIAAWRF
ncbi:MAG: autotransporter outer membrane beta-barrel domain-containing protein, partial [Rhodospirillales bacterium]|nr:autotransporter outer membrane beta-barrel domain-containing protein [Rhodospirillales bacterium]